MKHGILREKVQFPQELGVKFPVFHRALTELLGKKKDKSAPVRYKTSNLILCGRKPNNQDDSLLWLYPIFPACLERQEFHKNSTETLDKISESLQIPCEIPVFQKNPNWLVLLFDAQCVILNTLTLVGLRCIFGDTIL